MFAVTLPDEDAIPSLAYLGITILSMIVCKLLGSAEHESKSVDMAVVTRVVKARRDLHRERAGESLSQTVTSAEPKEEKPEKDEGKEEAAKEEKKKGKRSLNLKELGASSRWATVKDEAAKESVKKAKPVVPSLSSESGDEGVWHSDTEEGTVDELGDALKELEDREALNGPKKTEESPEPKDGDDKKSDGLSSGRKNDNASAVSLGGIDKL